MTDKRKQELVEQYDDAAFALMMDEYAEEEGEKLLKEFEAAMAAGEVPDVPESLDERCRNSIKSEFAKRHRKTKLTRFRHIAAKAAVVMLVLVGVAATTIGSVDALRVPFLNFWVEHFERHSTFAFDDSESPQSDRDLLSPLIPDDYQPIVVQEDDNGLSTLVYQNSNDQFIQFAVTLADGEFKYDSEDAIYEELKLLNHRAYLLEENGYQMIWLDETNGLIYSVLATEFNRDEFVAFCQNIAEKFN